MKIPYYFYLIRTNAKLEMGITSNPVKLIPDAQRQLICIMKFETYNEAALYQKHVQFNEKVCVIDGVEYQS